MRPIDSSRRLVSARKDSDLRRQLLDHLRTMEHRPLLLTRIRDRIRSCETEFMYKKHKPTSFYHVSVAGENLVIKAYLRVSGVQYWNVAKGTPQAGNQMARPVH